MIYSPYVKHGKTFQENKSKNKGKTVTNEKNPVLWENTNTFSQAVSLSSSDFVRIAAVSQLPMGKKHFKCSIKIRIKKPNKTTHAPKNPNKQKTKPNSGWWHIYPLPKTCNNPIFKIPFPPNKLNIRGYPTHLRLRKKSAELNFNFVKHCSWFTMSPRYSTTMSSYTSK